eukprot:CCRYP_015190-RA/>CCRYP_015190-RA protein AED:0.03 eAED:0.03 QI:4120/1/1/1/1/0.66/3/59/679
MSQSANQGRVLHDSPRKPPQESLHWKHLHECCDDSASPQQSNDTNGSNHEVDAHIAEASADTLHDANTMHSRSDLLSAFQRDVSSFPSRTKVENYKNLALWSCIIGYCEALSTHKDEERRYSLFPLPVAKIRTLVQQFVQLLNEVPLMEAGLVSNGSESNASTRTTPHQLKGDSLHRKTVQSLSNLLWKRAQNKSTSITDELHANNLYICLCGHVDNKSLDCFGIALLTVLGMNLLGFDSCLMLSEDHAYEGHWEEEDGSAVETNDGRNPGEVRRKRATCEVAIPGNTKLAQSKRGREISNTFTKGRDMTPETSWLYMASHAVVCDTPHMILAAMLANVNCDVEKPKRSSNHSLDAKPQIVSASLYTLKRDMLWILYDAGCMERFPFALMELGECEEHFGSERGMKWVDVGDLVRNAKEADVDGGMVDVGARQQRDEEKVMVLWNEKLFLDAISVSKKIYDDSQVYPYLYAGHYHKDAGCLMSSNEYRLVEALRLYSEATRVASKYKYETKDCMQLMKHMTTVASLISRDILLFPRGGEDNGKDVRKWKGRDNAVAAATWLLGFYDSLLHWEEREENSFVEILGMAHRYSLAKLFQLIPANVRVDAIAMIHTAYCSRTKFRVITEKEMIYFRQPRSRRLAKESLLTAALTKEKIVLRDMDMALHTNGGSRQRKRTRRDE